MIVVEGPDGSGKSTLVEKLTKDLDLKLVPRAVNSDAEYTVGLDEWVEETMRLDDTFICDRHQLISHAMYGPTMRRVLFGAFQSRGWLIQQLEEFWARRPIVVMCLPDLSVVKANLEVDDHKVAQADIDVFYWNYHIWYCANMPRNHVFLWDYTWMNYEDLLALINITTKNRGTR